MNVESTLFTDPNTTPHLTNAPPLPPEAPPQQDRLGPEEPLDRFLHAGIGRMAAGFSPMGLAEAWFDWAVHLSVSPARMAEIAITGLSEASRLAELNVQMLTKGGECSPCEHSLPQDKRFRHPSWRQWPFALFAESLLACERTLDEASRHIHGSTEHHMALLRFVGRQALDLVAPSNFPMTNPEVLDATLKSGGSNLVRGASFALEDLQRLLARQPPVGAEAFVPGHTLAITPGRVVHRTPLAEIIQYAPATPAVHAEPVVIIPAWIMKYYILDLRPQNSLVKHLVDAGFTVFMVSWKNPSAADRDVGLDDYRVQGVLPAFATALAITGARRAHAVGYCIGGTLLGLAAAAMARDYDDRIETLTFLAAQTDFRQAGELSLFVDESQLAILDDMMSEQGILEASRMASTFHLLRSNDLIWSRMIRHYLLGQREPMGDVAAWSTDATRMPSRMHSEYLRSLYLNNDLAEGRLLVDGHPVSLRDIRRPIFAVGTEWDHVAPWRSVFKLHMLTDAEVTFALTNGGHNQGIVSPPSRADRHVRIATAKMHERHQGPEHWLQAAEYHEGSWWPHWFAWLALHSSSQTSRPQSVATPGDEALGPAPGLYVHG
ncbi:PHA/PHB synthase family protein [Bosea sp. 2YAB26]|uniref:PHA/PHB synthase family protein n=1 Tax=Bosea sp. 2YAB26 TaxID=3237478 RepID=UPI003F915355